MTKLAQKILYACFTIFLAVTTIFFVIRLSPGDPIETLLGPKATGEEIAKLKMQLGMDRPLFFQYTSYLQNVIHADLGNSIIGSKNVLKLIKERAGSTMILAFTSISLSSFVGIWVGVMAGFKRSPRLDFFVRLLTLFALSFPIFSLAPLLVIIFSIQLKWLPVSEWGSLRHAILPILTLVIPLSSVIMRVTRNKFLEEANFPWVVVLHAKGMSEIQILWRILKVCMPTILNIIGIQLSVVLAGTMITETIYDIPGMGSLLFDAINGRDYPVVQGVIIYSTIVYMIIYFLIDYANEKIDPRIIGGSFDE